MHRLQRVLGDEQADRLLLGGKQFALLELVADDRRVGVREAAARLRRRSPASCRSKIEPWPICASCWTCWPVACAFSSTSSMPLRDAPVDPNAPHLISASIAFLLTVRQSTRSQKSHSEENGSVAWAGRTRLTPRALDRLDRRVADALDRVQAEADVAVDDHELVVGEVDVGRQDLDAHLLAARRRRTAPCPSSTSPRRSARPCTRPGSWPSARRCGRRSARSRRRASG